MTELALVELCHLLAYEKKNKNKNKKTEELETIYTFRISNGEVNLG